MQDLQCQLNHGNAIIDILTPYFQIMPKAKSLTQDESETLMLYADILIELPLDVLKAAMVKCALTSTFFPTIAEIFTQAESVCRQQYGTTLPDADEVWHEVTEWIKHHQTRQKVSMEFSCEELAEAVKNFGQRELLRMEDSQIDVVRAQFMRTYEAVVKRRREHRLNDMAWAVVTKESLTVPEIPTTEENGNAKTHLRLVKNS